MERVLPLSPAEAVAFRGLRARERLLQLDRAQLDADFRATLDAAAARLGLDPAGYGSAFRVDPDAGVLVTSLEAGHADRIADDHPA